MQTVSDNGQPPDLTAATEDAEASLRRAANKVRQQGVKDAATQFHRLREHWPEMLSADPKHIRPLASSAIGAIVEQIGWSEAYTRGVMTVWKSGAAYCRAILTYDRRYNLDGTPSDEEVDDEARGLARVRLDQIMAKKKARLAAANPLPSVEKEKPKAAAPAGKQKPKAVAPAGKQKPKGATPAKAGAGRPSQRAKGVRS